MLKSPLTKISRPDSILNTDPFSAFPDTDIFHIIVLFTQLSWFLYFPSSLIHSQQLSSGSHKCQQWPPGDQLSSYYYFNAQLIQFPEPLDNTPNIANLLKTCSRLGFSSTIATIFLHILLLFPKLIIS